LIALQGDACDDDQPVDLDAALSVFFTGASPTDPKEKRLDKLTDLASALGPYLATGDFGMLTRNDTLRPTFIRWLCSDPIRAQTWNWVSPSATSPTAEALRSTKARGCADAETIAEAAQRLYEALIRSRSSRASLPRPGGNITGFIQIEAAMSGKRLELLKEIAPGVKRAAIMFNPDVAPGGGSYLLPSERGATCSRLPLGIAGSGRAVPQPASRAGISGSRDEISAKQ
jgi:hypothetical protein